MRVFLLVAFFSLMIETSQAQYIKIATIASSGGSARVSNGYLSHVIGQSSLVSGTSVNQAYKVSQGFKQALWISTKKVNPTNNLQKLESEPLLSFVAYPNPFTHSVTLHLSSQTLYPVSIRCMDILGKLIWESTFPAGSTDIQLEKFQYFQVGKYMLQMFHQGRLQQLALIKQAE